MALRCCGCKMSVHIQSNKVLELNEGHIDFIYWIIKIIDSLYCRKGQMFVPEPTNTVS